MPSCSLSKIKACFHRSDPQFAPLLNNRATGTPLVKVYLSFTRLRSFWDLHPVFSAEPIAYTNRDLIRGA